MPTQQQLPAIFFGTDEFAYIILKKLLNCQQFNFSAVVTQPDKPVGRKKIITPPPVKLLAQKYNLPIYQPTKLNSEFINQLRGKTADIFIVAAYGKFLPAELINLPKYKTLNLHPSLLPKYRGPSPIQNALLNGEQATGASLMLIDEQMDHGPLISQSQITVSKSDNYLTLSKKLAELSAELLIKTLPGYISGKLKPQPQNHQQATFTKIIKKSDGLIIANQTAQQIYNMWRAYIAWPGIYLNYQIKNKNLNLKLTAVKLSGLKDNQPALKFFVRNKQLYLSCAQQTALQILSIQPQGKKPMNSQSFINGYLK